MLLPLKVLMLSLPMQTLQYSSYRGILSWMNYLRLEGAELRC